jgi:isopenicillin-N epimerase
VSTTTTPTTFPPPARTPRLPAPSDLARHFALDPEVVFLNHGSFGACPRAVLDAQSEFRARMEREPIKWFVETQPGLMDEAREALAAFVRCPADDLVFLPNVTQAVATILENLESQLKPGDELLAPGHEYPACMNNLRRAAARTGAAVVTAVLPFPVRSPDDIVDAVLGKVTPRTRVCLISHVTSPSGLILPVERIVPELERRGVVTIVDGAHAAGFVPCLDVAALGCSFYTNNCHKWLCSPKGSAFLYIREDRQNDFRPLALSNNAERPRPGRKHLLTEFDYVGTTDQTAYLTVPAAIKTMAALVPGGWPEIIRRNHDLVIRGRDTICKTIGVEPPAPDSMLGSLSTMLLPEHAPERLARLMARSSRYHDALQDALVDRHHIQVPVWSIAGDSRRVIRISAQAYNSPAQYEYLAGALSEELERERAL